MTQAFIGLLLGVLVISFVGIMAARAAKRREKKKRSEHERPKMGGFRTVGDAAGADNGEPDKNKLPNDGIANALSGTSGRSVQR